MPQRLFFVLMTRRPPSSPLFPYTTLFRSALAPRTRLTSCLVAGALIAATLLTKLSNLPIVVALLATVGDRKSTRLNSSHEWISYAVFCLKKKKKIAIYRTCALTHISYMRD